MWRKKIEAAVKMSRNAQKDMLKLHVAFETYVKLSEAATNSPRSTVKRLIDLKQKLEVSYVEFTQGFYFYKQDTVGKVAQTEEEFNKVEEGVSTFPYV